MVCKNTVYCFTMVLLVLSMVDVYMFVYVTLLYIATIQQLSEYLRLRIVAHPYIVLQGYILCCMDYTM